MGPYFFVGVVAVVVASDIIAELVELIKTI